MGLWFICLYLFLFNLCIVWSPKFHLSETHWYMMLRIHMWSHRRRCGKTPGNAFMRGDEVILREESPDNLTRSNGAFPRETRWEGSLSSMSPHTRTLSHTSCPQHPSEQRPILLTPWPEFPSGTWLPSEHLLLCLFLKAFQGNDFWLIIES